MMLMNIKKLENINKKICSIFIITGEKFLFSFLISAAIFLSSCESRPIGGGGLNYYSKKPSEKASIFLKPVEQWRIEAGNIIEWKEGEFVAATGGQASSWSYASFEYNAVLKAPYLLTVSLNRISNDTDRPVELRFIGGFFGVSEDQWYLYESEKNWTGWQRSSSINSGENNLTIIHYGQTVRGYVNGVLVGSIRLNTPNSVGKPGVFFKGDPFKRSKVAFKNFTAIQR
ncbi:LamG domain-containing protein [Azospirillum cavernae]|uniref:LamG domain-containing protein n=1 Tax=Azospirillum cavernae TaxID=2320860 RepID=UPI0011C391B2|nr:LamG domain-containing protein [Azospirillum cavernae]